MLSKPIPQPKPEPRKRTKRRQARIEAQIKRRVRAACVERDGYCRVTRDGWVFETVKKVGACHGPSQWMHLRGHRRSNTRGQAPAVRHSTTHSMMGCQYHHGEEEAGRLVITYLTARGCDGPIRFSVKEI